MPNLNRVIIAGCLTRDPELRYTPGNMAVAQIGVAINRKWVDKQGQKQEEVTFIDCEAWGKTAETINQYLKKGRPILIEGRLKLDQWQDKEGQNRSKLKVVVESFQFLDSGQRQGGDGEERRPFTTNIPAGATTGGADADDDVPFAADRPPEA